MLKDSEEVVQIKGQRPGTATRFP